MTRWFARKRPLKLAFGFKTDLRETGGTLFGDPCHLAGLRSSRAGEVVVQYSFLCALALTGGEGCVQSVLGKDLGGLGFGMVLLGAEVKRLLCRREWSKSLHAVFCASYPRPHKALMSNAFPSGSLL